MRTLLLLLLIVSYQVTGAEFPYEAYPLADLGEITTQEDLFAKQNNITLESRYLFLGPERRSSVVEYSGVFRDTPSLHKVFLADLLKSMPFIPKAQVDLYTREVLIKSGEKEFWALIQESLIPFMRNELKTGQKVKIFYFWFGASQHDHIIAINEFSAI